MILLWHLGLGDALVCQGLARNLARKHEFISLPCWTRNLISIRHMFDDLPNVKYMVISNPQEMVNLSMSPRDDVVRLGMYSGKQWDILNWDREMYNQADVPFHERWSGFKVPEPINKSSFSSLMPPYCFLHDDRSRQVPITAYTAPDGCLTVLPTGLDSIFDYVPYIDGAKEVHCIDSAFLCLTDSLPISNPQRLILHKYARNSVPPTLRRNWEVLK